MRRCFSFTSLLAFVVATPLLAAPPTPAPRAPDAAAAVPVALGYYRMPALRGETIVFVSEGDLWKVSAKGGAATRLTSFAEEERAPAISPDGSTVAFVASYEGPLDVYTMPIGGGLPTRRTFTGASPRQPFVDWIDDRTLLYASNEGTSVPRTRLMRLDLVGGEATPVPLDQASDGTVLADGTVVFTRLPFQGSHTDRYRGGTAQQLWRFTPAAAGAQAAEATPLTADYPGTSRRPHLWNGRIWFTTDRDGTLNLWSMKPDGSDLQQVTKHAGRDIGLTAVDAGRAVYQLGPDLRVVDLATGADSALAITLDSDMDQTREQWNTKPAEWITAANLSPKGDRVAITARGQVFVAPVKPGRIVAVDQRGGIRYRDARFLPDGARLLALSDESGEVELVTLPANGVGAPEPLTSNASVLRWRAVPSPDGKLIAHTDKDQRLFVFDVASRTDTLVTQGMYGQVDDLSWSPDSRWLAYSTAAENLFQVIRLWNAETKETLNATSDRYDSYAPRWSADGKWLWFLSDRTFRTIVPSPWGARAPEPFLPNQTKIYQLSLRKDQRSPWLPDDELTIAAKEAEAAAKEAKKKESAAKTAQADAEKPAEEGPKSDAPSDAKADGKTLRIEIDADGLAARLEEVPVPAGDYSGLMANDTALFWLSAAIGARAIEDGPVTTALKAIKIGNDKPEIVEVTDGLTAAQMSLDGKKILLRKPNLMFVIDAAPAKASLEKAGVDLGGWALAVEPREEWRQMFIEAWRLLRDYFYDRNMHGFGPEWRTVLDKYLPLVDRVRSRQELSDLLAEMTGELSALHHFVSGGVMRTSEVDIAAGSLGAEWRRDQPAGGWRITAILAHDPDEPGLRSPLADPTVAVQVGDVIAAINGVDTLTVPNPALLLRNQSGRQVLLRVLPGGDATKGRDAIARPLSPGQANELAYRSWELARRKLVEELGEGQIGYVHLRAMGGGDFADFARDYYPVFNRKGLIIDVRDNAGGNIDSWILSRLLRKPWMYWNSRVGQPPNWNMQYAFPGHMAALVNERTASDGEAFAEGFKRLGLGKVLGTRTWGGEIWLSASNDMVDRGIATAGEFGVYGPEGVWLIEGHGVEPDIVVDNLPHATFLGDDAQLKAAIEHLKQRIREQPVEMPKPPSGPDKRRTAP